MLKNLIFAAFWLPCATVLQMQDQQDVDSSLMSNLGHDIKTECRTFLFDFAQATKEFNMCAVEHAKPLRFCQLCPYKYTTVLKYNPAEFNDSNCVSDLVTSERFQIVMKVYDFQTELWREAHCAKCYIPDDKAGYRSTWNETKSTKQFFYWLSLIHKCFRNYTGNHTKIPLQLNGKILNASVCGGCRYYFEKLRKTYRKILEHTEDENQDLLCADIMSAMNDTLLDWKANDCWEDPDRNYTDLLLSFGIVFSTFIFYVGVQRHEKYKMKVYSRPRHAKRVVNYDSE